MSNQDPGPGLTLESRGRGALVLPEGVRLAVVRLQQWKGSEVGLGRLVAFQLPSGQSRQPEDEGAAEPRG